jgi:hypothetical protein
MMSRYIRQAFQNFCTLHMDGQQDDATVPIFTTVLFQPLPENAVYSTAASTVHIPQIL